MVLSIVCAMLVIGGVPGTTRAQEWCDGASKPDELAICGSAILGKLDGALMSAYVTTMGNANATQKKAMRKAQRSWLARRSACGSDFACIEGQYRTQIAYFGGEVPAAQNDVSNSASARQQVDDGDVFGSVTVNYPEATSTGGVEALIVANDQYVSIQDLQTPSKDAELITSALAFRGIKSETIHNAEGPDLDKALDAFAAKPDKNIFIFYYAGHAADINGTSSLVYTNFDLENPERGKNYESLPDMVRKISKLGYKKILIVFDACRNLVELPEMDQTPKAQNAIAAGSPLRNLSSRNPAIEELLGVDYAVSFSASKGQPAIDSLDGKNSPFAKAFAQKLREKETLFEVMVETRREVRRMTAQRQHPTLELSWDEDSALNANPIQSVTFTFPWDHKGRVTKNLENVTRTSEYGQEKLDIIHKVNDQSCGLHSSNATGVGFSIYTFLECIKSYYGVEGKDFTYLPETARDGITLSYEGLALTVDLDGDGKTERVGFGSNRYGGYLQFSSAGHTASFYSGLGPNISTLYLDDIDGNGIRDLIIEYASPPSRDKSFLSPRALAVISGEQLMSGLDGDFMTSREEAKFAPFIPESEWMGRVGGLYPILLFHDRNLKYVSGIVGQTIKYTTYETTWETQEPNIMPDKEATFAKDGSIDLDSGGNRYRVSSFRDPDFQVVPK